MADPRDRVGKLAFLDGCCVRVDSFISENGKCSVTRLLAPNQPCSDTTSEVEVDSLEFFPTKSFDEIFPDSKHISGAEISSDEVANGTVVELANNGLFNDLTPEKVWTITTSCRIIGEPTAPGHGDSLEPITTIHNEVHVVLKNANDIVEFEDLDFRELEERNEYAVVCKAGKSITFRRCRFSNSKYGVFVKSKFSTNTKKSRVKVYFEDCRFEDGFAQLLSVEKGGQVHLLNCTIQSEKSTCNEDSETEFSCDGVNVSDGGMLTAHHCTFTKLKEGISLTDKLSCAELLNCSFINVFDAVVLQAGPRLTASGCRITSCRSAFGSTGPQRTISNIDRCVILECQIGFSYTLGKHDSIITNCTVRCSSNCIFVLFDVVGYVDLVDVDSANTESGEYDCVAWSTNKCRVTIDNTLVPPKPLETIRAQANKHLQESDQLLVHQRCYKRAGVFNVMCPHCRKVEPEKMKFKKCARCVNVCYCSKTCQVHAVSAYSLSPILCLTVCGYLLSGGGLDSAQNAVR